MAAPLCYPERGLGDLAADGPAAVAQEPIQIHAADHIVFTPKDSAQKNRRAKGHFCRFHLLNSPTPPNAKTAREAGSGTSQTRNPTSLYAAVGAMS